MLVLSLASSSWTLELSLMLITFFLHSMGEIEKASLGEGEGLLRQGDIAYQTKNYNKICHRVK